MNRDELRSQLVLDEGLRLKPYHCTAGRLTIGIGRNLDDKGITKDEAMTLLENDILDVEKQLDAWMPWWRDLSDVRQQVMANMCFNLGMNRFSAFVNMLGALRSGKYDKAADEMLDSMWATQVGERAQRLARMMRSG